MKNIKRYTAPIISLILTLLLVSCSSSTTPQRPTISVTILPQKHLAEKIVGDRFTINCVVPANSNPEAYDPTPAQLMEIDRSQAYMRVGMLGFEMAWMERIQHNSPHLQVYDTSTGVDMIIAPHTHSHDDGHQHIVDPHIWCSPRNARIMAQNIYNAAVELDSENKSYYKANYDKLLQHIDSIDAVITEILLPVAGRSFAIYHPSLTYMARDYGLKQITLEDVGKENSAMGLKRVVDEARQCGVEVVFIQREFNSRQVETFAHELGAEVVVINPLNYNWGEEMINIAYAIARQ